MRIVRCGTARHPSGVYGLVEEAGIRLLRGGLFDSAEPTGEVIAESDVVRYLPPVDPPNVFALGRNYREHAAETGDALPSAPMIFMKATSAVIAHEQEIVIPRAAPDEIDYEAELAVIIGKAAKHVAAEDALDYVFGYTCANDVTARDCQRNDGQWARAKSFDTFAPLGPCVVTGLDPRGLRVQMRLNGEPMQDDSTSGLVFDVPYIISYLSRCITLLPRTVILTGTPSGVGMARKPPVFLKAGDVCEVEVEGIGILRNRVVEER